MATGKLPDIRFVRECLDYNPDTGIFMWRERPRNHFVSDRGHWQWNPKHAGTIAGAPQPRGRGKVYLCIGLNGVSRAGHRLAWLLGHGVDPWPSEIDHIDGNPLNNRLANLRLATRSQQGMNTCHQHRGTQSGVKGVNRNGDGRGWDAVVTIGGERHYIGYFKTVEEAAKARREAAERLHGAFVRHQ